MVEGGTDAYSLPAREIERERDRWVERSDTTFTISCDPQDNDGNDSDINLKFVQSNIYG